MPGPANSLNITQAGVVVFDGVSNFLGRTLTPGNGITIVNGNGIAGNPTISLTGNAPAAEHLTGDSGGVLNPDGLNNFNLLGQLAGTVTVFDTIGSGSTVSFEDRSWTTSFVVDPSAVAGLRGTFTTIAAAITAATSPANIYIRPGTYTENLTLKAGVNLIAYIGDSSPTNNNGVSSVIINGNCSVTYTGTVNISGIELRTNSANCISSTGSNVAYLNLFGCNINALNNTAIASSAGNFNFKMTECTGNLATTGIALWALTNFNLFEVINCKFTNGGASTTNSTDSSGLISCYNSVFTGHTFATSSTGGMDFYNCSLLQGSINATVLTMNGSGSNVSYGNIIESGSASAISVGVGVTFQLMKSSIKSTNTNAVTGAGTLNYGDLTFASTSSVMNTTTQTAQYTNLGKHKASKQPAFFAYNTTAPQNVTGDGTGYTVVFDTELFDQDNNFDGTSTFTAPVTGKYQFNCAVLMQNAAAMSPQLALTIAGTSAQTYTMYNQASCWTGNNSLNLAMIVAMTAGDTATVVVSFGGGAKTVDVYGAAGDPRTQFSGFLVC